VEKQVRHVTESSLVQSQQAPLSRCRRKFKRRKVTCLVYDAIYVGPASGCDLCREVPALHVSEPQTSVLAVAAGPHGTQCIQKQRVGVTSGDADNRWVAHDADGHAVTRPVVYAKLPLGPQPPRKHCIIIADPSQCNRKWLHASVNGC